MKAVMPNYVYWPGMDKDMEKHGEIVQKLRIGSKSTSHKIQSMALDKLWSRLHIDNAGSIKGTYLFCHSRQLYEMARSFQMQNTYN